MNYFVLLLALGLSYQDGVRAEKNKEGTSEVAVVSLPAKKVEDLKRLRQDLLTATEKDPKNAQSWLHLGLVEHQLGDLEAAKRSFEEVVKLDSAETAAHYMLALIYEKKGWLEKAVAAWKACRDLSADPNLRAIAEKHLKELQ